MADRPSGLETRRGSAATVTGVTTVSRHAPSPREAQERLWRALTKLDAIDQPGADPEADRDEVELEVMVAWTEYERSRSA